MQNGKQHTDFALCIVTQWYKIVTLLRKVKKNLDMDVRKVADSTALLRTWYLIITASMTAHGCQDHE
jgi:hypothetical protein